MAREFITIKIQPTLISTSYKPVISVISHIVEWYAQVTNCIIEDIEGRLVSINSMYDSIIIVVDVPELTKLQKQVFISMIKDPDDDGNYPVEIDGKKYLVCG